MSKRIGFKTNIDEDLVREIKIAATIGEIDVNDILEPVIENYLNPEANFREKILYRILTKKARNNTYSYEICRMVLKLEEEAFNSLLKELQEKECITLDGKNISITDKGKAQGF